MDQSPRGFVKKREIGLQGEKREEDVKWKTDVMGNITAMFQPLADVSGAVDRTKEPTLRSAGKGG